MWRHIPSAETSHASMANVCPGGVTIAASLSGASLSGSFAGMASLRPSALVPIPGLKQIVFNIKTSTNMSFDQLPRPFGHINPRRGLG